VNFYCFSQKSAISPWQHTILGWFDHLSPKYSPLGSFWPNFEKMLNCCKQTPKFEKLRFFLFNQLRLMNSFPESGHSYICEFLFRRYWIYSKIWPYGRTVHSAPRVGINYFVNGEKRVQKPFFVKIHVLVYAKMPNIAVLGLLEVIGAPVKALLCADFKNGRAKIHILLFISKRGVSRLWNAILLKNSTVSYRCGLILLEFMPFL